MSKSKKNSNQEQFRHTHLTADWDGCAANDFFARQYRSGIRDKYKHKVQDNHNIFMMEVEIAESDFFRDLASSAFSKTQFITAIRSISAKSIAVPDNIVNKSTYVEVYLRVASDILSNIERGKYDFQHPA